MLALSLAWPDPRGPALHAAWRRALALPAPPIPGLRARQWLLDGSVLQGYYLFDDPAALARLAATPVLDPAYAALAALRPDPPRMAQAAALSRICQPVFIVAAPRSGSTLLFDLLAQAPGIWTQGGEGQGAIDGIAGLHAADRDYDSDRIEASQLTPDVIASLHAAWSCGLRDRDGQRLDGERPVRLLDKTTENSLRVAFLAQACPDARFIFLHRDARQNVSSLMQAWRHPGFVRWQDLPGWPHGPWCFLLPPGWRGLRDAAPQTLATAQWDAANRWALHDLEVIDRARWMALDYNALLARPAAVLRQLCNFLELDFDHRLAALLNAPLAVSGTAISPPSAIKWRSNGELEVERLEAASRGTGARLRDLHSVTNPPAPPAPTAAAGKVRFACRLDEVPVEGEEGAGGDWLVEPSLRCQLGASIPLGMATATRFRERFLADEPILWTRDALTQAYRPYWVARQQTALFRQFQPGAAPPPCPAPLMIRLRAAGIVGSAQELADREKAAQAQRRHLRQAFAQRGYCVVKDLLAPAQTHALARYYRELIASGCWAAGDGQVAQRHGWHNESVARFFHYQLTGLVGAVAGETVCPSYTYVSAYRRGAELNPHVDRKQCIYTLSVVIDENGGRSADWPLWFLAGATPEAVSLGLGQGVLFRGHDLPHWREAAPQTGLALSSLLFHYVPATFGETLD